MSAKRIRLGWAPEADSKTFGGVTPQCSAAQPAPPVIVEPTAWLRIRCAERWRQVERIGLDVVHGDALIIAPLGRSGVPGAPSDRECDRCERVTPHGDPFYALSVKAAPRLLLAGGLCEQCAGLEGVTLDGDVDV